MSHYDHLDPAEIGKKAWKAASRAAKHMSKHSRIVNPALEKCIPRFERSEVVLGEFLGSGGFNDVYEIKRVDLVKNLEDAEHAKKIASPLQQEHREFIAKHVFRESSQNCRYAMKFLSVDTIGDPGRFCTGAADLVVVRTAHSGSKIPYRLSLPVYYFSFISTGSQISSFLGTSQYHQASWYGCCRNLRICDHGRERILSSA
jgi:hypothetical protein